MRHFCPFIPFLIINKIFYCLNVFKIFFKKCLAEGGIPFEVKTNCNFYSSESGMAAFLALRKQAENNGLTGMSLDEINAEIHAARTERKAHKA